MNDINLWHFELSHNVMVNKVVVVYSGNLLDVISYHNFLFIERPPPEIVLPHRNRVLLPYNISLFICLKFDFPMYLWDQ